MEIFRAAWIIPVDSPPIAHGALAVEQERIVWLGAADDAPPGTLHDLGEAAILPGLINAHTHLELSAFQGRIPRQPLWTWFDALLRLIRASDFSTLGPNAVREGAAQSLAAGVTCVADISRTGLNVAALRDSPIRKVCFLELISGAAASPFDAETLRRTFDELTRFAEPDKLMLGLSPHSPYTVTPDDLAAAALLARQRNAPITMHFLETTEEAAWLASGSRHPPPDDSTPVNHFRKFLASRRLPTANLPPPDGAFELLDRTGLLASLPLLAHVNYVGDGEIVRLARSGASVVFCPRTHAFFGHAPHRWREMLSAGVNVCLGTDSLAGNDSLSILDELRFLHRQSPDVPPRQLLEMATLNSARALGLADRIGGLAPGKYADFIAFSLEKSAADPVPGLIQESPTPTHIWIAGRLVQDNQKSIVPR